LSETCATKGFCVCGLVNVFKSVFNLVLFLSKRCSILRLFVV